MSIEEGLVERIAQQQAEIDKLRDGLGTAIAMLRVCGVQDAVLEELRALRGEEE